MKLDLEEKEIYELKEMLRKYDEDLRKTEQKLKDLSTFKPVRDKLMKSIQEEEQIRKEEEWAKLQEKDWFKVREMENGNRSITVIGKNKEIFQLEFTPIHLATEDEMVCETKCPYKNNSHLIRNPREVDNRRTDFCDFCSDCGNEFLTRSEIREKVVLIPAPGSLEKTFSGYPEVLNVLNKKEKD